MQLTLAKYDRGKYVRKKFVGIRFTTTELVYLKKLAKKKELSLSQLMRSLMNIGLEKEEE